MFTHIFKKVAKIFEQQLVHTRHQYFGVDYNNSRGDMTVCSQQHNMDTFSVTFFIERYNIKLWNNTVIFKRLLTANFTHAAYLNKKHCKFLKYNINLWRHSISIGIKYRSDVLYKKNEQNIALLISSTLSLTHNCLFENNAYRPKLYRTFFQRTMSMTQQPRFLHKSA